MIQKEDAIKLEGFSKQPKRTGLNKSSVNELVEGDKKLSNVIWDKDKTRKETESGENLLYLHSVVLKYIDTIN